MRIVQPDATVIARDDTQPLKFIEKIGRTCYKSEDAITDESSVKFCNDLKKRKHYAMLEHLPIHMVLDVDYNEFMADMEEFAEMARVDSQNDLMKYMYMSSFGVEEEMFFTASLRVFLEIADQHSHKDTPRLVDAMLSAVANKFPMLFDVEKWSYRITEDVHIVDWAELKERMESTCTCCGYPDDSLERELKKHNFVTVHFICDRGVSHELVRHRPCSFAQESTRYCNYSKDKFGNEITVVKPLFFDRFPDTPDNVLYDDSMYSDWLAACEKAEGYYFKLLGKGAKPQEARSVLPNSLKTEVIVTANEAEWQHIMNLRFAGTTGAPHPQMKEVMDILYPQMMGVTDGRVRA